MTARRAVVVGSDGEFQQLQSGDTLTGPLTRLTGGLPAKPAASLIVPIGIAPVAFTVSATNSAAQARTAATGSLTVTLKKRTTGGTETTVGTFAWSASGTLATVSISAGSIGAGDMLLLDFGATPDATLADFAFLVSE